MALFGLGTLPLMLGLSLTGWLVPGAWRQQLRRAVPVLGVALAGLFIVRGLGFGVPYLSPRLGTVAGSSAPRHTPTAASVHYCH